jgi:hypothetical protein
MKTKLLAIAASALLTISVASFANQAEIQPDAVAKTAAPGSNVNLFDPNYWLAAMTSPAQLPTISKDLTFNAAHPGGWMQWIDPRTHQQMHMTFVNPASFTQFMRPQFYMEFTRPENMAAWMNPASYQVLTDPQTMNYWINPASYMHMIDPAMYTETMNPANYMVYLNPATYAGLLGSTTCDQGNPNGARGWFGYGC